MEICRILAMTRWEMENYVVPEGFSPAVLLLERELTDLPSEILAVIPDPEDPLLLPEKTVDETAFPGVVLDFQKPGQEALVNKLAGSLPCPVAVSELYAHQTQGPVFLSPCPPDKPLEAHLAPWKHREIWLDTTPQPLQFTVTPTKCHINSTQFPQNSPYFTHKGLHCHYISQITPEKITFTLWRDRQMLESHIRKAEALGVTKALGLFQEWNSLPHRPE